MDPAGCVLPCPCGVPRARQPLCGVEGEEARSTLGSLPCQTGRGPSITLLLLEEQKPRIHPVFGTKRAAPLRLRPRLQLSIATVSANTAAIFLLLVWCSMR